jgi:Fic family protein
MEKNVKEDINADKKVFRLWSFVEFNNKWQHLNTSVLDDIAPSWFSRRERLKENSTEYIEFINRLKREHAIETGVVERLYDLKKGITETFIKEGFVQTFLSHGDTNVPTQTLMNHLKDHLEAVDFVFDIVKENRPLTTSFIKELHQLVTRHQSFAEGRDQFGNKTNVDLLRGTYKVRENNPTREDGTLILYCSPDHVAAEMDNLVAIYNDLVEQKIHPIIISAWVHHAFTTIHPFQDGNGRVARLLASLILIKFNYFPFTVLREEARVKYIDALEKADNHEPQMLINYFCEIQRRNIEKALNIKEVSSTSFLEVTDIFSKKLEIWHQKQHNELDKHLYQNRKHIFDSCFTTLNDYKKQLEKRFNGGVEICTESASFDDFNRQQYYYRQLIQYTVKYEYYFNRTLPIAWILFKIKLSPAKNYQLGFILHHFGYENTALAIGAFLEFNDDASRKEEDLTLPLDIKPYVISMQDEINSATLSNINSFLENSLTLALAEIASELI